jgi:hypothetical protein
MLIALQLSVRIEVPGEDGYHFQPRLFGKVLIEIHVLESFACLSRL